MSTMTDTPTSTRRLHDLVGELADMVLLRQVVPPGEVLDAIGEAIRVADDLPHGTGDPDLARLEERYEALASELDRCAEVGCPNEREPRARVCVECADDGADDWKARAGR